MMTGQVKALLCVACLVLSACASQTGYGLSQDFDRSIKAYNRMLRWHEIESAGMTYIDPELREEYLKRAEALKKQGISFTDFRILSAVYVPEKKTGDAVAEFDYYLLPSNRVRTISYRQKWVYTESGKKWELMTGLPDFE